MSSEAATYQTQHCRVNDISLHRNLSFCLYRGRRSYWTSWGVLQSFVESPSAASFVKSHCNYMPLELGRRRSINFVVLSTALFTRGRFCVCNSLVCNEQHSTWQFFFVGVARWPRGKMDARNTFCKWTGFSQLAILKSFNLIHYTLHQFYNHMKVHT